MAVESEVAVILGGSEDHQEEPKEALPNHDSGEVINSSDSVICDDGSVNGVRDNGVCDDGSTNCGRDDGSGSFGSRGSESKAGSNGSDYPEQEKSKIRILVSSRKKPVFFYINLAKKYLNKSYDVELSALGLAIPTVITISECLKRNGVAVGKGIRTSTVTKIDEEKGRTIVKAQIEIVLGPCDTMDEVQAELSSNLIAE